jgi:hypothetical protein
MAERVEIMVVATDAASQVMRGVTASFGQLGTMVQSFTASRAFEQLASSVVAFGKDAVDSTVKYANEVRNLSLVSGQSTENTSRFLQVLDDYKLTAEDAMTATRTLTKQGLTPNLETLAKLSDQYLSISDKQKQNEFIIKNLGRAGLQWVDVLNKGSKALLEQGAAIDESLILTQKAVDDARRYEIALDNWSDSVQGLKVSIGTQLLPVLTAMTNDMNAAQRAQEILGDEFNATVIGTDKWNNALAQAKKEQEASTEAMIKNADATAKVGDAHEKTAEQIKAEEDAIKALTEKYQGYLSLASDIFSEQKSYDKDLKSLMKEKSKLETEYDTLSAEGWKKNKEKLEENLQAYQDVKDKIQEVEDKHTEAMGKMQYDLLVTKLSVGGLTTAEYQMAVQAGVAFGVFDQSSADAAVAMSTLTDKVASGKISVYEYGEIMKHSMKDGKLDAAELQRIIANIPEHKSVTIDVATKYTNYFSGVGYVSPNVGSLGGRAGGGDVAAGMLYKVNETRTEYFKPSMSGTVLPMGGGNGSNAQGITFIYSPQVSLGNANEAQTIIAPFVEQAVRRMQSDGKVAL